MLFTVRNRLKNKTLDKLEIAALDGMMGIVNRENESHILPFEYDNVFVYGEDIFVVHKKGKIGAVRMEEDRLCIVAKSEYDTLESIGHDLIFCNDTKVSYYNSVSKSVRDFIDIIVDIPFLYCKDKKYQYILYGESGREIYKKEYTSYSESCFCFCGNTDKGPVFYDARYSTYLYPTEEAYKVHKEIFNHPIIVNRQNVLNITEGDNGIGVIDSYGKALIKNQYDSVKIELKVTAAKGNETEQKIIPFQKIAFEKGMVSDIEDWL